MNTKPFRPPLLHDHLDGSNTLLPVLPELFKLSNKRFPFGDFRSVSDYASKVKEVFKDPQVDIVQKFRNTTGVMQSKESLALAAYSYTCERAKQGFAYCEATIAPQYHRENGLTVAEVIEALVEGIKAGEKEFPGIEANLIFTIGREIAPEEGVRLVDEAAKCDRDYVVGVGLACDEAAHPPQKHIPAFRRAKELGFHRTVHAGEWVNLPPNAPNPENDRPQLLENMRTAIVDLHAERIGHAIPLAYDKKVLGLVTDNGIGIEGCPGSNLSSGLIPNMSYLKIRDLITTHLYTMNPDDDLFMPDLNETFALCDAEYHFTENEKQLMESAAWAMRFGKRKKSPASTSHK